MSEHESAVREIALEQIHQLLVEVRDHLEEASTKESLKLCGKVELVLENWNDDAFFVSDKDEDEDEEGYAGEYDEQAVRDAEAEDADEDADDDADEDADDDEDEDADEDADEDEDEDEGSILDALPDDEEEEEEEGDDD